MKYQIDLKKQVEDEWRRKEQQELDLKRLDYLDEIRVKQELKDLNDRYMGKQPWQRNRSVETPSKSKINVKWKLVF